MITKTDLMVLAHFRQDARCRLTTLSRKTGIPVSTLFDKLREYEPKVIPRIVSLLNFEALGFSTHVNVLIKAGKDSLQLREHLVKHPSVNSLYKVHDGFDYLAEGVFRNLRELDEFVQQLKHSHGVRSIEVQYLVDDLKREGFLADPSFVDQLLNEQPSFSAV
jgi:DNA-binding Lrp family transcriptional regulator